MGPYATLPCILLGVKNLHCCCEYLAAIRDDILPYLDRARNHTRFLYGSIPPLQLVPEERALVTHPGKLFVGVLRSDLVLIHGISLLVESLVR